MLTYLLTRDQTHDGQLGAKPALVVLEFGYVRDRGWWLLVNLCRDRFSNFCVVTWRGKLGGNARTYPGELKWGSELLLVALGENGTPKNREQIDEFKFYCSSLLWKFRLENAHKSDDISLSNLT